MSRPDHVQRLGSALGWSVAARVARVLLGLVGSILVVRGLGMHEYGILAVIRNVLAFLLILVGAGLSQGILRYLHLWRRDPDRRPGRTVGFIILIQVLLWAAVLLVFWIGQPLLQRMTGELAAGFLLLGVALLLPEVVGATVTQVANALYDARGVSFAIAASSLLYVGLVAVLLDRGLGITGVLLATGAAQMLLLVLLLFRVRSQMAKPEDPEEAAPAAVELRDAFRYSLPFLAIGILNLITWRQSEVLFLGWFRTAGEAGIFDLAYRLPQMILEFVPGAIWPLVMAGFAEVYTRDPRALQRATAAYYKLLFLLVAPMAVGGVLTGDLAVRFLYGGSYDLTGTVCQILFFVFGISFLTTPLGMVFYVLERSRLALAIISVTATLNLGLDLLLIPRYGVAGAVVPVCVVMALSPAIYTVVLRRIGVRILIPWGFLARVYAAAAGMLVLWPLRDRIGSPWELAFLVLAGMVLFLVGIRIFRVVGPEEQELFERANFPAWKRLSPILAGRGGRPS